MNMRRVITKAIHRSIQAGLAIEVAMEAGRRGVDAVPTLLKKMFTGAVASPRSCRLISPPSSLRRHKALRQLNKTSLTRKMGVLLPTGFDDLPDGETAGIEI